MAERLRKSVPLARRVLVVQVLVVVLAVGVATVTAVAAEDRLIISGARDRVRSVAISLAENQQAVDALRSNDPGAVLAPLADRVLTKADLSFVVFMDPEGIRYTHPDPDRVGEPYIGDLAAARARGIGSEVARGTLGESIRTVVRIDDPQGGVVLGFVAVGVTLDRLRDVLLGALPLLLGSALAAGGVGVITALLFGIVPALFASRVNLASSVKEGGYATLAPARERLRNGFIVAQIALGLVLVEFTVVLMRYVFGLGSVKMQESIVYMHAIVFMVAAGYTLLHNGHVRCDVFYAAASPRRRLRCRCPIEIDDGDPCAVPGEQARRRVDDRGAAGLPFGVASGAFARVGARHGGDASGRRIATGACERLVGTHCTARQPPGRRAGR